MMFKVTLWYVALIASIVFPPLFIVTLIPLILSATSVFQAMQNNRDLKRTIAYHQQVAAYYAEADRTRSFLS